MDFDTVRFVTEAIRIGVRIHHHPSLPTYEELVSSGKLNMIRNEVLKSQLTIYVNRFQKYFEWGIYLDSRDYSQDFNKHLRQYFSPLMMRFLIDSHRENTEEQVSISQLKEMCLDMAGYLSDPKSLYHLSNVAEIHSILAQAYEGNLQNILVPLIDLVHKELN